MLEQRQHFGGTSGSSWLHDHPLPAHQRSGRSRAASNRLRTRCRSRRPSRPPLSSRNSQARASAQRRFNVAGDMSSASAASSMLSPTKYAARRSGPVRDRSASSRRQRLVERGQHAFRVRARPRANRSATRDQSRPSLLRAARAGTVDEDLPHRSRGNPDEVPLVGPGRAGAGEPQIRLVHERGRLAASAPAARGACKPPPAGAARCTRAAPARGLGRRMTIGHDHRTCERRPLIGQAVRDLIRRIGGATARAPGMRLRSASTRAEYSGVGNSSREHPRFRAAGFHTCTDRARTPARAVATFRSVGRTPCRCEYSRARRHDKVTVATRCPESGNRASGGPHRTSR